MQKTLCLDGKKPFHQTLPYLGQNPLGHSLTVVPFVRLQGAWMRGIQIWEKRVRVWQREKGKKLPT